MTFFGASVTSATCFGTTRSVTGGEASASVAFCRCRPWASRTVAVGVPRGATVNGRGGLGRAHVLAPLDRGGALDDDVARPRGDPFVGGQHEHALFLAGGDRLRRAVDVRRQTLGAEADRAVVAVLPPGEDRVMSRGAL